MSKFFSSNNFETLLILIVDDHQLFANGLKFTIEHQSPNHRITHCQDGESALAWITANTDCDIVLLDLEMPGTMTGESFLRELRRQEVWTPVIIVSAVEHPRRIQRALNLGASGFISKSASSEQFIQAMQAALNGEEYLQPSVRVQLEELEHQDKKTTFEQDRIRYDLTPKQIEVLQLASNGLSNKEIATRMKLTVHTVKAHLSAAYKAMDASNRTDCVKAAERLGLIRRET
ncbi:MAG: response regulator transcription factor [Gammaproteobacteria bacterium]|nr:response regulator transcription factor [Gammaproteobacteria bacterium]